jgi:hypothetical protein
MLLNPASIYSLEFQVMGLIGEEVAGRLAKEKELMKVKIKREDVDLIVIPISSNSHCFKFLTQV